MNGTITISPDPCAHGEEITITCTGGVQGSWTLSLYDENSSQPRATASVTLDENGNGTATATIDEGWGFTLVIEGESGSGLDSYSGSVGAPTP